MVGVIITLVSMAIAAAAIWDSRRVRLVRRSYRDTILYLQRELAESDRRAAEGNEAADRFRFAGDLWHNFRAASMALQERGHTQERVDSLQSSRAHLDQLHGWVRMPAAPISHIRAVGAVKQVANG